MRIRTTATMISALLAATACGGGGSSATVSEFVNGCLSSTNLDRAFCECAAENARDELSADGFAFVTATFGDDDEAITIMRNKLGPTEAIGAGMFMVNAYKKCAGANE